MRPPRAAAGFRPQWLGGVSRISKSGLAAKVARERLTAMPYDVAEVTNWRRDMPMRCYLFAHPRTCTHSMADIFCHPHPAAELAKSRNDRLWPSASFRCKQRLGRFRSEADIERQAIVMTLQPVILDRHILPFDIAGFVEALAERGHKTRGGIGCSAADNRDHWHRRLLRLYGKRPRERRGAESGYEPTFVDADCHLIC